MGNFYQKLLRIDYLLLPRKGGPGCKILWNNRKCCLLMTRLSSNSYAELWNFHQMEGLNLSNWKQRKCTNKDDVMGAE